MRFEDIERGLDLAVVFPVRVLVQDLGLNTLMSCGGHTRHNPRSLHVVPYPYIVLDEEYNSQGLDLLEAAVQDFGGGWVLERTTGRFFERGAYPVRVLRPQDQNEEEDSEKLASLHSSLHLFACFVRDRMPSQLQVS